MKKLVFLLCFVIYSLNGQTYLEVQGKQGSSIPAALIKANPFINQNAIGLRVESQSQPQFEGNTGTAGHFIGGKYGVLAESDQTGIYGKGTLYGVYGENFSVIGAGGYFKGIGRGVVGESNSGPGVIGTSTSSHGAYFKGGNDKAAIVLQGSLRSAGGGGDPDDCVIMSDPAYSGSDLWLLGNDAVIIDLDDDDNESGNFVVRNGSDVEIFDLSESGNLSIIGDLTQGSDLNRKERITTIDYGKILSSIVELPIYEWQYIGEKRRHIGPMAQDFYELFELGDDETTISSIDRHGVALASIKALHEENLALRNEMKEIKQRMAELEKLLINASDKKR